LSSVSPHLRDRFARLILREQLNCGLVSATPAIVHLPIFFSNDIGPFIESIEWLFQALRGQPLILLCSHSFLAETHLEGSLQLGSWCAQAFPDVRLIHLCNEEKSLPRWLDHGLEAIHCNHNAFVDERVFSPLKGTTRAFRAVYDARLVPFKRHALAAQVDQLALIYYVAPALDDLDYAEKIRRDFAHTHFFNHPNGGYERLGPAAVNECLNRCRTGLCLSDCEGAMYASIQYLLSGLGVVSTPNSGGRDDFFSPDHSLSAEPTPEAVSQAVGEMLARRLDPWEVRGATLARIQPHRNRFCELVQSILDDHGQSRRFAEEWPRRFHNRFLASQSHRQILQRLGRPKGVGE